MASYLNCVRIFAYGDILRLLVVLKKGDARVWRASRIVTGSFAAPIALCAPGVAQDDISVLQTAAQSRLLLFY